MTHELYKFEFSENFSRFRRFRTQQQLNERSFTYELSIDTPGIQSYGAICGNLPRKTRGIGLPCGENLIRDQENVVSTSNWSNFGMLSRRAGLSATAGLSCYPRRDRVHETGTQLKLERGWTDRNIPTPPAANSQSKIDNSSGLFI